MSRPATRSKNKRRKSDNAEDSLSEILRKIHTSNEISGSNVIQLYHISRPVCEGCRVNSKDSPNCFCGLVPASNGTRKSGLWQKMSEIVSTLGPDPCKDFRTSTETPAGLTNLGATCYANSILQCLYMNTSFRSRILSVEMELFNRQPVLKQLARLFAQLHSCKMAFVDSAPFIKTLELDNGVQQDSHEFFTLFLSLLERSLSHSKVPKARNVVQDLFRGGVSHVTRCSECGKDSESSSKMEDFYELELNIKGLTNLHESLEDYLSVEELNGENQYFCESCAKRVDATRSIKLRSLPSVLNFQLKRYVFLPKTTTKKKITTIFSFPRQLNMGKSLSDCAESTYVYDLSAILIHKGSAANSGHYVAHIKDENTGQWWEFDDEHVAKLGTHPFGEEPSKSSAKSGHSMEKNGPEQVGSTSNGFSSPSNSKTSNGEETFSSSDAYMLMYCRKNDIDSTNMVHDIPGSDVSVDSSLPFHLSEEIQQLNASYTKACEEYQLKKNGHLSHISKRREEVKSVLSEAPVHSLEGPYFWISTDWLRHWADNVNTPCMDNSAIQCLHGKVPFTKIHSMKRVSSVAWTRLFSEYGGGPTLTNEDWCSECIKDIAKNATFADDYRDKRASLKELATAALAGKTSDPNQYYVSRAWLNQWIRRKNADPPCEADVGPTASLRCPHNGLLPEQAAGAKRVLVPEALWLFLYDSADAVKPDDSFGCQAFPADTKACEICSSELMEVASQEDNLRTAKLIQRQNHEKLFLGKGFALYPGHKYFLVSSSWLANWRSYVTTTGKNVASSMELERLEASIDSLICEKHSQLLERPPELVRKRGMITQEPNIEGLTLIPEDDWRYFCEEWDVTEGKGISAEILLPNDVPSNQPGSCEEMPIAVVDSKPTSDVANGDMEFEKLIIRTCPEICEVCIGERESCELMQKLNYSDAEISVFLVSGKEAPKSLLQASGLISKLDRRYSKRSRKTTHGNSVNFRVACSTTIYQLKMMIWESFGVVKENQKLHKGSLEIEGDTATLADKNIFPEDVLWVRDTEIHENRDIADELSEQKIEFRQTEEGFRGSLLTSVASDQVLE